MINYPDLILRCSDELRAGQVEPVVHRLQSLSLARVPLEYRLPMAKICRRAGLFGMGLRLLRRVLYPEKQRAYRKALPAEAAEYAALLFKIGAVQEALSILNTVDAKMVPEADFYRAGCHIREWDYATALPFLQSYYESQSEPYARLIAAVNLGAAHMELGNLQACSNLIEAACAEAESAGHRRLQSNCLEILAQMQLRQERFPEAKKILSAAAGLWPSAQTRDQLFVTKWQAVVESMQTRKVEPLLRFRELALSRMEWESVREADLGMLRLQFDEYRFQYLLFGTPYVQYREKILQEIGSKAAPSEFILGKTGGPCFDINKGELDGKPVLNQGKKIHQILNLLVSDFYRPVSIGGMFSSIFPGEHFNIDSSPLRIHQLLRRTRRFLNELRIPARIEKAGGDYRLAVEGQLGIRVPLVRPQISTLHLQLRTLGEVYPGGCRFTAGSACEILNIPRSTFQRLAKQACEAGALERFGRRKLVEYRLIPERSKEAA